MEEFEEHGPAAPQLRLAGMALQNGVLVIGPRHWAAAVRASDGGIEQVVRRRPSTGGGVLGASLLRGPVSLVSMLAILPALKRALPQARLPIEAPALIGTLVVGGLASRFAQRKGSPTLETAVGLASLASMMVSVRSGPLAEYHGAEHKVIGGYEQGIPAQEATREHERCGTHLALPMLIANTLSHQVARRLLPRNRSAATVVGSTAGMIVATEFARHAQARPTGPVAELAARVGTTLQTVGSTKEPSAEQLEVAQAALDALLVVESREM